MLDDKRALGDKTMIFVYLFFMIVIGVGIYAGINIFFAQGYEFKETEANLLSYKIRECIMENEVNDNFKSDFYNICRLNKDIVEKYNIIRICRNSDDCIDERNPLIGEGSKFQACRFEGTEKKCVINSFSKDRYRFDVIVGSTQFSRRSLG